MSNLSSTNAFSMSVTTKPTTATTIVKTDTEMPIRAKAGLPLTRAVSHDSLVAAG
jgi:hypothetical protein